MVNKNKITYNTGVYFGDLLRIKNEGIISDSLTFQKRKTKRLSNELINNEYDRQTKLSSYDKRRLLIYGGIVGDFFIGQYHNVKNMTKKIDKKIIKQRSIHSFI